jgi:predicted nucleic acid-binding protein
MQPRHRCGESHDDAAAVRAGCAILYMEDLQQGQMIEKLQIRNPFAGS